MTIVSLAGLFAVVAVPLLLDGAAMSVSWSALALILFWIGMRIKSTFLARCSYVLYMLIIGTMLLLNDGFENMLCASSSMSMYLDDMLQRLWSVGALVLSLFTASWLGRRYRDDTRLKTSSSPMLFWSSVFLLFIYMCIEVPSFAQFGTGLRLPSLTMVWCGMGLYVLSRYRKEQKVWMLSVAMALLALTGLKVVIIDIISWMQIPTSLVFSAKLDPYMLGIRCVDVALPISVMVMGWRWVSQCTPYRTRGHVMGYASLLLLFIYTTFELNSLLHWIAPAIQYSGLSVYWVLFATSLAAIGIKKRIRTLRYAGLGLWLIALIKLALYDLSGLEMMYRVIAFLVVGVALLLGAFLYIKAISSEAQKS